MSKKGHGEKNIKGGKQKEKKTGGKKYKKAKKKNFFVFCVIHEVLTAGARESTGLRGWAHPYTRAHPHYEGRCSTPSG